jgi:hypothetical protein
MRSEWGGADGAAGFADDFGFQLGVPRVATGVAGRVVDRGGGVGIGETQFFAREPVAVQRGDARDAVGPGVRVAQVIGIDHDDLGLGCLRSGHQVDLGRREPAE